MRVRTVFNSPIGVVLLCLSFAPQGASGRPLGMGIAPTSPVAAARNSEGDLCGQEAARRFIGSVVDETVQTAMAKATGHNRVRWIHPGEAVTQDCRADRLNVITDGSGRILTVRCG